MSWFRAAFWAAVIICAWKGSLKLLDRTIEVRVSNSIEAYQQILEKEGVLFPRIAICQNVLETGMFSSKVYKENHNPFGMKASRRDFDRGDKNGHAYYPHTDHLGMCTVDCLLPAIRDYAAWQKAWNVAKHCKTEQEYIYYIQHLPGGASYAEDKLYERKILYILKSIE